MLAERLPVGSHVLVIGGPGVGDALRERGLVPVESVDDGAVALMQGYGPDVGWRQLAEGSLAIGRGLLWVATNLDRTIPTPRGRVLGNGSMVEALRHASGVDPLVAGKPEPPLMIESVQRSGALRPLVVGDRLDTDIEGANRSGIPSMLVLTGVTDWQDLLHVAPPYRPTYLGRDLRALLTPAPAVEVRWGTAVVEGRCGRVVVRIPTGRARGRGSSPRGRRRVGRGASRSRATCGGSPRASVMPAGVHVRTRMTSTWMWCVPLSRPPGRSPTPARGSPGRRTCMPRPGDPAAGRYPAGREGAAVIDIVRDYTAIGIGSTQATANRVAGAAHASTQWVTTWGNPEPASDQPEPHHRSGWISRPRPRSPHRPRAAPDRRHGRASRARVGGGGSCPAPAGPASRAPHQRPPGRSVSESFGVDPDHAAPGPLRPLSP